jgi:hypothetical protein
MTHDDRISSYIDNEFTAEQEQEFLISLAASEGLRKSFRSELVLKKVLHRDEAATAPPRRLRAAVFATLGLGGAGLSTSKANAAQPVAAASRGLIKTFFATKMSTLATVAGLSISAIAGYGVRLVVSPAAVIPSSYVTHEFHGTYAVPQNVIQPAAPAISESSPVASSGLIKHAVKKPMVSARQQRLNHSGVSTEPVTGTAGGGTVSMEPPKINPTH